MNAITSALGILIAVFAFWGTAENLSSASEPVAETPAWLSSNTEFLDTSADDISLKGSVVDQYGRPVAGVIVVARPDDDDIAYANADNDTDTALTDANGHFVLEQLSPGRYSVIALGSGHPPGIAKLLITDDICPDDSVKIVLDRIDEVYSA